MIAGFYMLCMSTFSFAIQKSGIIIAMLLKIAEIISIIIETELV